MTSVGLVKCECFRRSALGDLEVRLELEGCDWLLRGARLHGRSVGLGGAASGVFTSAFQHREKIHFCFNYHFPCLSLAEARIPSLERFVYIHELFFLRPTTCHTADDTISSSLR